MDSKVGAEFSITDDEELKMSTKSTCKSPSGNVEENNLVKEQNASLVSASASPSNLGSGSSSNHGDEIEGERTYPIVVNPSSVDDDDEVKKCSSHSKTHSGKKKVKVDWTPELHKKFVQAVEQMGLDKAVPSKILDLMGVDCLTRHNVASHLQKYRTQRKHVLAREAEAATWSRKRQLYGTSRTEKRDVNSWVVKPTAFPSVAPKQQFTPLHVWGHPSADQSWRYIWPNQLGSSPPPPPVWAPAHHLPQLIPGDTSSWYYRYHHHHHQDVPAPGVPYFPRHPTPGFNAPSVPGQPPMYMYRVEPSIGVPVVPSGTPPPEPSSNSYPSTESLDAAIGDVLSKPYLPFPLGLKPPSIDSVMEELQRQGICKVPQTCNYK